MPTDDKAQIIFGTFDGMTSAISIIVPMLLQNNLKTLFPVIVSLALGDGFTMGFGEFLADENGDLERGIIMGLATAVAIFTPAIPFFIFSTGWAAIVALIMIVLWSRKIGKMRNRPDSITLINVAVFCVIVFGAAAVWVISS